MSLTLSEALKERDALEDALNEQIRTQWQAMHRHRRWARSWARGGCHSYLGVESLYRYWSECAKRDRAALKALLTVRKEARDDLYGVTR